MARRGSKLTPDEWSIQSGAVGKRLGKLFQLETAPALVTNHLHVAHMAVTELRSANPVLGVIEPVPTEDAFLVGLLLKDLLDHQVWEDGRALPKCTLRAGQFLMRDLNRVQSVLIDRPHHSVHFYLPRAALDEISNNLEAPRIAELHYRPGVPFSDPVVSALGSSLLPALGRPEQANRMFVEYVTFALGAHVAQAYGGLRPGSRRQKGGLAGWQEKRAKEALSASLRGEATLRDVARQCGLSVSHFSRAFKDTTGVAPHQWLVHRRVEVAKSLLKAGRLSLSDIASECGFANQSHFTRVFSRIAGLSPGAWRRCCGIEEVESWPGYQD
jgi:AraC-like DNA-binding protein